MRRPVKQERKKMRKPPKKDRVWIVAEKSQASEGSKATSSMGRVLGDGGSLRRSHQHLRKPVRPPVI